MHARFRPARPLCRARPPSPSPDVDTIGVPASDPRTVRKRIKSNEIREYPLNGEFFPLRAVSAVLRRQLLFNIINGSKKHVIVFVRKLRTRRHLDVVSVSRRHPIPPRRPNPVNAHRPLKTNTTTVRKNTVLLSSITAYIRS